MSFFRSIKLFRIAGIPLELHTTFLLIVAFAAFQGWSAGQVTGAVWMVLLILAAFVCVILHELGHCMAARRYGVKIQRILLLPIGGVAQFQAIPRKPGEELIITIAGPIVNFVIAFILAALFQTIIGWPANWEQALSVYNPYSFLLSLLIFNLVMGTFNLLPIFPLDGGRILRAILAYKLPYLKATTYAVRISQPLAFTGLILGVLNGALFVSLLFLLLLLVSRMELTQVENFDPYSEMSIGDILEYDFSSLDAADPATSLQDLDEESANKTYLVLEKHYVLGAMRPSDLPARLKSAPDLQLRDLPVIRTAPVQAEWPVTILSERILQQYGTLIPVYRNGDLIGVVDPQTIEERKEAALKHSPT